ncbi:MAG TPA: proline dehydrogenase family protein [Vicinamibacterales bacterium]
MLDAASKAVFQALAGSRVLRRLASRYGMASPTSFARRFIAGETLGEAIEAVRRLEAGGLTHTLDYLGESVATAEEAAAAADAYVAILPPVVDAGIGRNLSLKLTQLGLALSEDLARDHLRRILEAARPHGFFVRVDMENSPYTEATLRIVERLRGEGHTHVGIVLQSALRRTDRDLERAISQGIRVRLVKGAYREPPDVAHQRKTDVDAAYARQMTRLLLEGDFPALATHDERLIDEAREVAARHGVGRDRFEFQMLYGIRRDLQNALVADGYRVRVYVPFGREWFPYFMRRLGERPANVWFVLRSLAAER